MDLFSANDAILEYWICFPSINHRLEILFCFLVMMSSAGAGKQMILRKLSFLEILICFPILREKAISWKGETDILWKQPRWLLLIVTACHAYKRYACK